MAILFLDSSALVKRYIVEAGSAWVVDLLTPSAGNSIHISVKKHAPISPSFRPMTKSTSLLRPKD